MSGFSRRELFQSLAATAPFQAARKKLSQLSLGIVPELTRVVVPVPGLDRRLDGMRIGQVSDVHIGQGFEPEYLKRALAVFGRVPPDVMVSTGDMLDDPLLARACFDLLAERKAPYGTFYSLGNHENFRDRNHIIKEGRSHAALKLLVNESVQVEVQGARFFVSGVDFPLDQSATSARTPVNAQFVAAANERSDDGDFRLCLAHHPDDFDEIRARGVELTLSGHTHGGQTALADPLTRKFFTYFQGLYRSGASHLYVNSATGGGLFFRIGRPPEVTELTLRRV